ncbi:MAG TPA: ABC transporter substrate-binding protein [Methylomusa anaerophila]|uniref:ABC transporter substrate-binding protein n=1 Tax=Methylomusa anaerophila TaxID=1930071 RepID=UPI0013158591|nr:ABC transporter substrate-binding protein [Methylomusa anaerophila]HML90566.1 ABC transporter substrate-binding protein [Methylomusa anaerophila]
MTKRCIAVFGIVMLLLLLTACGRAPGTAGKDVGAPESLTVTVTDQLGRRVEVPRKIEKIGAIDHFEGHLVFALGQQDKLVHQALFNKLGAAMARVDEKFKAKPQMRQGREKISTETMAALGPQVVFMNSSFDRTQLEQFESAGLRVIGLKGETLEDSFDAVRLMAKVLGCEDRGAKYIVACENLLGMVKERLRDIPGDKRLKVMFAGPKNIYSVATGSMLQTSIIETAGGKNVAGHLTGYWADVSPEQVANWNPDVIFLGSSLDTYGADAIFNNPQLAQVKAVQEGRVYSFPSNIDWWDYPAPHHVLGAVWAAKTLYPDKFADIDMTKIADEFYTNYLGHSFTSLGGKL